jgi:hypothetical protein
MGSYASAGARRGVVGVAVGVAVGVVVSTRSSEPSSSSIVVMVAMKP